MKAVFKDLGILLFRSVVDFQSNVLSSQVTYNYLQNISIDFDCPKIAK